MGAYSRTHGIIHICFFQGGCPLAEAVETCRFATFNLLVAEGGSPGEFRNFV